MQHKRDNRIVFYTNDEEFRRLEEAIAASDLQKGDWLRQATDSATQGAAGRTLGSTSETQAALATAQAHIDGLEALVQQQRERQGMSDSLNQELNQRLKEAHAISDRFQLALPAGGETGRSWWQFWQTSSPAASG